MSFPSHLLHLKSEDYTYHLPEEAIARFPLEQRDASRLLVWENGQIRHRIFRNLAGELPDGSLLVLNDTQVLPARLHFRKETGSWIELLILEHRPGETPGTMICKALIGSKKKWKHAEILRMDKTAEGEELMLQAEWRDRDKDEILLRWEPANRIFPEILALWGEMPIPPYLNRKAEASDKVDYQTVYAKHPGAVAAPTAGLHFTEEVFQDLREKSIRTTWLTLHVGMGTFRPLKAERVAEHDMHPEEVLIPISAVKDLAFHRGPVIAVGTTSVRSLESLYWLGLQLKKSGVFPASLESAIPYLMQDQAESAGDVFAYLLRWMEQEGRAALRFNTSLYLMPSYTYRVVNGMVTNFHQPESTLMVLVASFLGDAWREVYQTALKQGYRFLSYGDSSLLLPLERK